MSFFLPIIEELNENSVNYVAVGGVAAILHGHTRLTTDIDFVIELEVNNVTKALQALKGLGYVPKIPITVEDFADPKIRESWIREKGMQVLGFTLPNNPLVSVDIFVEHPIEFSDLFKDSKLVALGRTRLRICSINHLIEMKKKASRAKDLEDIRVLELLAKENG